MTTRALVTGAGLTVSSPQSTVPVWVSSVPASENPAVALRDSPSRAGADAGAVEATAVTDGAAFATRIEATPDATAPVPSRNCTVAVYTSAGVPDGLSSRYRCVTSSVREPAMTANSWSGAPSPQLIVAVC